MRKFAIVVSRFNQKYTEAMLQEALRGFKEHGAEATVKWVPGAFELPLAAKWLAESKSFEAVVCIGVVIRGETAHFDYVCHGGTQGILDVGLQTDVPIIFTIMTTENAAQAEARIYRGFEGAMAAIEMANLKNEIKKA